MSRKPEFRDLKDGSSENNSKREKTLERDITLKFLESNYRREREGEIVCAEGIYEKGLKRYPSLESKNDDSVIDNSEASMLKDVRGGIDLVKPAGISEANGERDGLEHEELWSKDLEIFAKRKVIKKEKDKPRGEKEYQQRLLVVKKRGAISRLKGMLKNNELRLKYLSNVDFLFVVGVDGTKFVDLVRELIPFLKAALLREIDPKKRMMQIKSVRFGFIGVGKKRCVRYKFQEAENLSMLLEYVNTSSGNSRVYNHIRALEMIGGMNWEKTHPTRLIFQMTDTPCHGKFLRDTTKMDELLLLVRRRMVHYHFFLVPKGGSVLTSKMASKFQAVFNKHEKKRELGVKFGVYSYPVNEFGKVMVSLTRKTVGVEYMMTVKNLRIDNFF